MDGESLKERERERGIYANHYDCSNTEYVKLHRPVASLQFAIEELESFPLLLIHQP